MALALDLQARWARLNFSQRQRLRIYHKLAKLLDSGMPLLRCLEDLYFRESRDGTRAGDPVPYVLWQWMQAVRSGARVGDAVRPWVPSFEQMIISSGDESGDLPGAMRSVITFVNASTRIRKAVVGGSLYPLLIMAMVLLYLILFGMTIVPKFAVVSKPENWQGVAKSLHIMSTFVQQWWAVLIAAPIAGCVLLGVTMPRWKGRVRAYADVLPPWSIYRMVVGSGFLTAVSALVSAGIPVERAISTVNEHSSPWLRERLTSALYGLKSGLNLGEALRHAGHEFPSREIVDDLCVYARFGGFANALQRVSSEWIAEGVQSIETRMRAATGAAVLLLSLVIVWIVLGFFGIQQEIANINKGRF